MRALRFLQVSTLCILIAGSVALNAQDEKRQPEPPQRQEEPRPETKQGDMKAPQQEHSRPEAGQGDMRAPRQEESKPPKQDKKEQKQEEKRSREQMKSDQPMNNGQHAGRPAGKSAHIPEDKFRSSFGRPHTFVVQRPVIVQGQPGFYYGGYSFVFIDAWPGDWAYTDDCYVDYIDGEYFLFDVLHPGIRIALFVVM